MTFAVRPKRRHDLAVIGLLGILTLTFFWQGAVQPAAMANEDAAYYYQPYYEFAAAEVRAGRIPLWNPYCALGIPYHAGLQGSLFYPLRWPTFWMDYRHGYALLLWVHYFLTAVAAYLLMRVALQVGPLAGLLGTMGISFGGFAMGHLSHFTYFMSYPWFLGALLFVWLAVERRQWHWAIGAGVCVGLMGLIGSVHLLLILAVALGTYVIWRTARAALARIRGTSHAWIEVFRPALTVCSTALLGAMIGAVQLLPALALIGRSAQQAPTWEYINMACAHPLRNTLQLVVPFYFGNLRLGYWGEYNYHDTAHYTGALTLMAAAVGMLTFRRDRRARYWLVLALVGFVIGAGDYLPVYRVLYDWVPGFGQLRNPTRLFWCTEIALCCLAALGLERMLKPPADERTRKRVFVGTSIAGLVLLATLTGAVLRLNHHANHPDALVRWVNENPKVLDNVFKPFRLEAAREVPTRVVRELDPAAVANGLAIVVAAIGVPVLIWRNKPLGHAAMGALVLLLAADLFTTSLGTMQYERHPYEHHALVSRPPRATWLEQNLRDGRYMTLFRQLPSPDDQITWHRGMQFRIRNVGGFGGGILDFPDRIRFCRLLTRYPKLLDLAGVRYVFAEATTNSPHLQHVRQNGRYHVYENPTCLPPAFFVQHVTQVSDPQESLAVMCGADFDPGKQAVVFNPPPVEVASSRAQDARVTATNRVPGRWDIETQTDAPAQLVVSEGYDPGWRCRINGTPASILRTNDQFMSVPVPAGNSRVVLEYAPPEFRRGAILSGLGLLLAAGASMFALRRRPA